MHAPQVGRVTVVGCVCRLDFPNSNELAKKIYRSPQCCKRCNYNLFFLHKTASLQNYRTHVKAITAQTSAILLAFSCTQAYLNHMTLLWTRWCFSCRLCIVCTSLYSAFAYLNNWTLISTTRDAIHLTEGMFSGQCSMHLKKVCIPALNS